MQNKVLVIAAHPDDEVLGCGATIAQHIRLGDEVHVAILAEGLTSRANQRDRKQFGMELNELSQSAQKANEILGCTSLLLHDFPDNRMDSIDRIEVIKFVEKLIAHYQPQTIYTHHAGDVNIDHQIIHEAVVTACRPIPNHPVETLLFFEIPSSTEWQVASMAPPFIPNWYVDITQTLSLKLKALEEYKSEIRNWPHPRSVEAVEKLAQWRGATIGTEAAEAFVLGRKINRYIEE